MTPIYIDKAYHATETTFVVLNHTLWDIDPANEPMLQWCRDHGIDPHDVVASEPIERLGAGITYGWPDRPEGVAVRRTVPLDAPPAPWPNEVQVTP